MNQLEFFQMRIRHPYIFFIGHFITYFDHLFLLLVQSVSNDAVVELYEPNLNALPKFAIEQLGELERELKEGLFVLF